MGRKVNFPYDKEFYLNHLTYQGKENKMRIKDQSGRVFEVDEGGMINTNSGSVTRECVECGEDFTFAKQAGRRQKFCEPRCKVRYHVRAYRSRQSAS